MYRKCITAEAANRQAEVEQCLFRLMGTMAYDRISVSTICEKAGISRTAFYRYYKNKDACLQSMLDRLLFDAAIHRIPFASHPSREAMLQILRFWRNQGELLDILLENGLMDRLMQQILLHIRTEEREVLHLIHPDPGDPCGDGDLVFLLSGVMALLVYWHKQGFPANEETMADKMLQLLTRPLVGTE